MSFTPVQKKGTTTTEPVTAPSRPRVQLHGDHDAPQPVPSRAELGGMGYEEGAAALSPRGTTQPAPKPGDVVPEPAKLNTERPLGTAVPNDIRTRLLDTVKKSARTAALLKDIDKAGGASFGIVWAASGVSQLGKKIQIDRRWTFGMWLTSFSHELSHLLDHLQGKQPDVTKATDRAAFVAAKVGNEIKAHALQYAAHWELAKAGVSPGFEPKGYTNFMTHFATTKKTESAATIEAEARTWLKGAYKTDPSFETSTTHENYYDYWGGVWDKAHPKTTP